MLVGEGVLLRRRRTTLRQRENVLRPISTNLAETSSDRQRNREHSLASEEQSVFGQGRSCRNEWQRAGRRTTILRRRGTLFLSVRNGLAVTSSDRFRNEE
jgi:hypothetical protein